MKLKHQTLNQWTFVVSLISGLLYNNNNNKNNNNNNNNVYTSSGRWLGGVDGLRTLTVTLMSCLLLNNSNNNNKFELPHVAEKVTENNKALLASPRILRIVLDI